MNMPAPTRAQRSKSHIVLWVALMLVTLLAMCGAVAINAVYSENRARVAQQMSDEARLANHDINAFFLRYMTIVEQAEVIPVFERYFRTLTSREQYDRNPYYRELLATMDNIQASSHGEFLVTWVCALGTETIFQSSNVPWVGDATWTAKSRPWYENAINDKRPFLTAPYIESATGRYVVSLICPVTNKSTGEVIGVFGADLRLDPLTSLLKNACPAGQDHLVLITPDDTIAYHPNSAYIHKAISTLPYSQNILTAIRAREAGEYTFSLGGESMRGNLSVLRGSNWLVLSELSQRYIDGLMTDTVALLAGCFLLALVLLVGSLYALRKLLDRVAQNELFLEQEVQKRTLSLHKQDAMLWTVNDIAKKLLATHAQEAFDATITDCLRMIGEAFVKHRVYIWKDMKDADGRLCCTQVYEWVDGVESVQGDANLNLTPYEQLPSFRSMLDKGVCLNKPVRALTPSEKEILEPQGIQVLLIAPVVIEGVRWGFVGVDDCESSELFSELEENILLTSGFMLASAILRQTTETQLRETEELVQAMFDATPLCCTVWNRHFELITCNEGAVRLFGLENKQMFFDCFSNLSPEFQPCGRRSEELRQAYVAEALQMGSCVFEWMHQTLDGEPLPAHVTFVHIKYQNEDAVAAYVRDLRELKSQEAQRREAEERTQVMLNAMPLCCNFWNKDLENLACNEEAVRLFGLSSQQEYLDRFFELSPERQPDGRLSADVALEKITQAFAEGVARFEWMHQKLDGTPIPADITLVRMLFNQEYIVVGYTRDLRELKAMLADIRNTQHELAQARDEAVAHSKAKSDFLAKMSHEIRTPMNAIVGMCELMLRESLSPKAKEHALTIKQAGAHLLSIINDILDFSKIESGKLEISPSPYLFSSLLNDVINIIRVRLMEKPIVFTVNVDPKLPNSLVGDDIRIRQVLLNILNNAIKYTKEGFVALTVEGERLNNQTLRLRVEVADSGVGIKEEDLASLFGQFVQFDTAKHKGVEGTGLGLAIARSLARSMGGDISVASTYGEGSVFTVTLLQEITDQECIAEVVEPAGKNILLYEPRAQVAGSIIKSMEDLDVEHALVVNQSELFESLNVAQYEFIFLSVVLFETARQTLEQMHCLEQVVVLTEHGEIFVDKNIQTVSMPVHALTIANVLNGVRENHARDRTDLNIRFSAPRARVLVVDDISTNLKVAEGLMAPYGMCIDVCESGAEAIELVQTTSYDVVFMDHMMPGMNGVEATLAIRELPEGGQVPIVALTANAVAGIREMFLSNGFNDFLAKPIETSKLNTLLERWIPKDKQEKYIAATLPQEADIAAFAIEGVNVARGIVMTGGTVEQYVSVLSIYHKDGCAKLKEVAQALEQGDIGLYTTYVHALKSASANIGAEGVSEFAKHLELTARREDIATIQAQTPAFLSELEHVLENIRYVITAAGAEGPAQGMSAEQFAASMLSLKNALEVMDAVTADGLINTLQAQVHDAPLVDGIDRIAQSVLLCEYDEAISIIDTLLAAQG